MREKGYLESVNCQHWPHGSVMKCPYCEGERMKQVNYNASPTGFLISIKFVCPDCKNRPVITFWPQSKTEKRCIIHWDIRKLKVKKEE